MICFLRLVRRCFAVKGEGTGVLTAWCIGGAVLGVKASELVACLTLANEIPFITILRCVGGTALDSINYSLNELGLFPWVRRTDALSRPNLVNRPFSVLGD